MNGFDEESTRNGAAVFLNMPLLLLGRCLDALLFTREKMAGWTGIEPATSDVTGRRSNRTELPPHLNDAVRIAEFAIAD